MTNILSSTQVKLDIFFKQRLVHVHSANLCTPSSAKKLVLHDVRSPVQQQLTSHHTILHSVVFLWYYYSFTVHFKDTINLSLQCYDSHAVLLVIIILINKQRKYCKCKNLKLTKLLGMTRIQDKHSQISRALKF